MLTQFCDWKSYLSADASFGSDAVLVWIFMPESDADLWLLHTNAMCNTRYATSRLSSRVHLCIILSLLVIFSLLECVRKFIRVHPCIIYPRLTFDAQQIKWYTDSTRVKATWMLRIAYRVSCIIVCKSHYDSCTLDVETFAARQNVTP